LLKINGAFILNIEFSFLFLFEITSMSIKTIEKSASLDHENGTNPSLEVPVKAINYPPGYPDNKSKEQCNKKEEKHKDCHPMHCHHMQPMQSTTNALFIDTTHNHSQQNDSNK